MGAHRCSGAAPAHPFRTVSSPQVPSSEAVKFGGQQPRNDTENGDAAGREGDEPLFVLCGMLDGVSEELDPSHHDPDQWQMRPVVVEVKHRMGVNQPPSNASSSKHSWRNVHVSKCQQNAGSTGGSVKKASSDLLGTKYPPSPQPVSGEPPKDCGLEKRKASIVPPERREKDCDAISKRRRCGKDVPPPPLYDQIQLVFYMMMMGTEVGHLVEVRRSFHHDTAASSSSTPATTKTHLTIHRVTLDGGPFFHRAGWKDIVVPRLYSFVSDAILRLRRDQDLRDRWLVATASEQWRLLSSMCSFIVPYQHERFRILETSELKIPIQKQQHKEISEHGQARALQEAILADIKARSGASPLSII